MRSERAKRRTEACIIREALKEVEELEEQQAAERQYVMECEMCWKEYEDSKKMYYYNCSKKLEEYYDQLAKEKKMPVLKSKVEEEIKSMIEEVDLRSQPRRKKLEKKRGKHKS